VLDYIERKIIEAAKDHTAMSIRRPVLSVGCAQNRRVAESNPRSRKRIPFALIHLAVVKFFMIGARQK